MVKILLHFRIYGFVVLPSLKMLPSPQGGECSMLRAKCHNLKEKILKRMVTELKLRVAKYYDYAFSGEGTYSNVVHSECADVSQGAVYHVHVLC